MAGFVGKAVDLVFDARAIARAHAFDLAGEHGAAVKAAANDVVGRFGGVGDPTRHLARVHVGAAHEAEHRHRTCGHAPFGGQVSAHHAVAGLFLAAAEVNAAPIQSRWRAGFQPAVGQLEFFEPRRQTHRWRVAGTATGVVVHAHMDLAVQKRAGGQHHRARSEANTNLRHSAHHAITFDHQVVHGLLKKPQFGLVFQAFADGGFVQNAVSLGAGGAHGRAFGSVEDAKLNARLIGGQGHGAAHGVNLFDQMALANAADRRVATHLAQGFNVVRQQQRCAAHARRGQGGLGPGVSAADHNHVKGLGVEHLGWGPTRQKRGQGKGFGGLAQPQAQGGERGSILYRGRQACSFFKQRSKRLVMGPNQLSPRC